MNLFTEFVICCSVVFVKSRPDWVRGVLVCCWQSEEQMPDDTTKLDDVTEPDDTTQLDHTTQLDDRTNDDRTNHALISVLDEFTQQQTTLSIDEVLPLSLRFNGHFPRWIWVSRFIAAKDDGSGGDNWSHKISKAQVKSSPPTPNILQARCPSNSVKALKGKRYYYSVSLSTWAHIWCFKNGLTKGNGEHEKWWTIKQGWKTGFHDSTKAAAFTFTPQRFDCPSCATERDQAYEKIMLLTIAKILFSETFKIPS